MDGQTIDIKGPDNNIYRFPAGTSTDVIRGAMQNRFGSTQQAGQAAAPREIEQPQPGASPQDLAIASKQDLRAEAMFPGASVDPFGRPLDMGLERQAEDARIRERQVYRQAGEQQLRQGNIRIGEAPLQARIESGLGMSRLSGYRAALGPDFEVKEIETEGPYKGEIVFRRKGEPTFQTVRDPEALGKPMDFAARARDIQSVQKTAVPELLGTAGAMAAAALPEGMVPLLGPIARTALGAFGGRMFGETQRLKEGQSKGIVSPDDPVIIEAAKLGMEQGLWEAGGVAALSLFRALAGRGIPDMQGITQRDMQDALARIRLKVGDEGAKLATVGDVLAEMGRTNAANLFKSVEEKIARTARAPSNREFAERMAQKEQFVGGRLAGELPEGTARPGVDVEQLGRQVEAAAPGIEEFTQQAQQIGGRPGVAPRELATSIQETALAAEKAAQAPIQAGYKAIEAQVGGSQAPATATGELAEKLRAGYQTRLFPNLSSDSRSAVNSAVDRLYETVPDPADPTKEIRQLAPVTYRQLDDAISDIRTAIRKKLKGEWTGELRELESIEKALLKDRDDLLRQAGGNDLVKSNYDLDADWRRTKDIFRRGDFADAFRVKATEARAITAENFLQELALDKDTASAMLPYLTDPQKREIRALMVARLSDLAQVYGKATSREIGQAAVEKVLMQADSPFPVFFNRSEIDGLIKGGKLQRTRKLLGVEDRQDFSGWFNDFYKEQNTSAAKALYKRLGANPALADTVRGLTRQRLYDEIAMEGPQKGTKILNMDAFDKLMQDDKKLLFLQQTLGSDFPARMRVVADATTALFPKFAPLNLGEKEIADATVKGQLVGAARAVLGPLSPMQRRITYATKLADAETKQRIARAILDPEYFGRILEASRSTAGSRATAAGIGAILSERNDMLDQDQDTWLTQIPTVAGNAFRSMRGD
jgi:hypothetical protein